MGETSELRGESAYQSNVQQYIVWLSGHGQAGSTPYHWRASAELLGTALDEAGSDGYVATSEYLTRTISAIFVRETVYMNATELLCKPLQQVE